MKWAEKILTIATTLKLSRSDVLNLNKLTFKAQTLTKNRLKETKWEEGVLKFSKISLKQLRFDTKLIFET